jgi:serpin B
MKMKRLILMACATLIALAFSACDKDKVRPEPNPTPIELTAVGRQLIANSNDFGIQLFSGVAREEQEADNLMLSPLSASIALTMLLNGCDGDTYEQIHQMLGYPAGLPLDEVNAAQRSLVAQLLQADNQVDLGIANALFYRLGFEAKPAYLEAMRREYSARIEGLDFSAPSALSHINQWASDATKGRIPEVLDEIHPATVLFLMNALYFKGEWTYKFDKAHTSPRPFRLGDGSTVDVPTMAGEIKALATYGQGYAALELPYGRRNFSMVVVVPEQGLAGFYDELTPEKWRAITSGLDGQGEWQEIQVSLPKFKFEYERKLNDDLMALGMTDAFDEGLADLSGISDAQLFVSRVKQNTFVEVNEEGTEAAAVTVVDIRETSLNAFAADRPFIFAIRERTTNALLFIGAVKDPR